MLDSGVAGVNGVNVPVHVKMALEQGIDFVIRRFLDMELSIVR